jgi:hypothetical protein
MLTFTDEQLASQLKEQTGETPEWSAHAFTDLDDDVRDAKAKIASSRARTCAASCTRSSQGACERSRSGSGSGGTGACLSGRRSRAGARVDAAA